MSSDKAYSRVKSSKLMFKGASKPKKVIKRQPDEAGFAHRTTEDVAEREEEEEEEQIRILSGSGRVTSSGTTIFGHETLFSNELAVGDAIVVSHPQSLVDETKIVRMVLSNVSISVSSAFSCDLVSTAAFRYVKAPKPKHGQTESSSSSSGAGVGTEEEQRMRKLHQVVALPLSPHSMTDCLWCRCYSGYPPEVTYLTTFPCDDDDDDDDGDDDDDDDDIATCMHVCTSSLS